MWPFKKKEQKEQYFYFNIDWDKIENLEDLKFVLSKLSTLSNIYAKVSDMKECGLLKYMKH